MRYTLASGGVAGDGIGAAGDTLGCLVTVDMVVSGTSLVPFPKDRDEMSATGSLGVTEATIDLGPILAVQDQLFISPATPSRKLLHDSPKGQAC